MGRCSQNSYQNSKCELAGLTRSRQPIFSLAEKVPGVTQWRRENRQVKPMYSQSVDVLAWQSALSATTFVRRAATVEEIPAVSLPGSFTIPTRYQTSVT